MDLGFLRPLYENPPHPTSSASGAATVTWDVAANTMRVDVQFSGLSGTTTASHIHCCIPAPGNIGVATTVPTFTGFPLGVTSGTYSHTFDMLDPARNTCFLVRPTWVFGLDTADFAGSPTRWISSGEILRVWRWSPALQRIRW